MQSRKKMKLFYFYPYGQHLFENFVFPEQQIITINPNKVPPFSLFAALLFFKNLTQIKWPKVSLGDGFFILFLKCFVEHYLRAFIVVEKPVAVLTYVDNSGLFHRLSRSCGSIPFFAVQNGGRDEWDLHLSRPAPPHPSSSISLTNLFCFGQYDVDLHKKFGHSVDNFYCVGSLEASIYAQRQGLQKNDIYDICLISQWHQEFFDGQSLNQSNEACRDCLNIIHQHVTRLIREENYRLAIALRSSDPREKNFFERLFGDRAEYIESDVKNFSSIQALSRSKLSICCNSTLWWHAVGFGWKTLWYNPLGHNLMKAPKSLAYLEGEKYSDFRAQVLKLREMSYKAYDKQTRKAHRAISSFSVEKPAHETIRNIVLSERGLL